MLIPRSLKSSDIFFISSRDPDILILIVGVLDILGSRLDSLLRLFLDSCLRTCLDRLAVLFVAFGSFRLILERCW